MRATYRSLTPVVFLAGISACGEPARQISMADYQDKVYASWLAQCIGNMYGLSHEFKYNDEPRTEPIEGWMPDALERIRKYNGAFSDDDTDIEYVCLFCMEKYGPEPTYEQVAEFWKRHINRYIWVANRCARELMALDYLPPLTGRRGLNPHWYQIDPQLVCEIWAVTAPGMLDYAAAKADWAAKVTNDGYGTHPTLWYNTMYAAAFFETDVEKLCRIGYEHLPPDSIFRTAIDDVRRWKAEHGDDWVAVRKKIKAKYHDREGLPEDIATGRVSALLNGTLGVLALLYGEGDFERTMNYACMAGYDADNQCATLAGLVGIMHGSAAIPRKYTHVLDDWTEPMNDFYKNRTRDDLPDGKITEIARRTAEIGRQLVCRAGGRVQESPDGEVLMINPQAQFVPPLEIRLFPVYVDLGQEVTVYPEVIGGRAGGRIDIVLAGTLPPGLRMERQQGRMVIAGTPTRPGRYEISATVRDGTTRRETRLPIFVRRVNLALSAAKILAAEIKPTGRGNRDLEVLRNGPFTLEHYDTYDGENELARDFYGYEWSEPVRISRLLYRAGPAFERGGWFETLGVEYRDGDGQWKPVEHFLVNPPYSPENARKGKGRFTFTFKPVTTRAVRIVGKPGGPDQFTSIYELAVPKMR